MDFSAQNPATSNALNLAARSNDTENVSRLLNTLNPNIVDNRGWTCLHEAAYSDGYESLMLILNAPQIRAAAETHEGHTALYLACKNNCSLITIRALLDSVEDIANYGSTEGVTPLHIACSHGNVNLIELLIEYGAMLDVQDFDDDTPLHEAVLAGEHEALLTLLYAGADADIMNTPQGFTPFHLACCKGYFPNVESLYPFIYDINQQTHSGCTALHFAVQATNIEIVNFLLEHGADPNIKNDYGELPIDLAYSNADILNKLLATTDREKLDKQLVINACKPHNFQFDVIETLLCSDLGPEFYNVDIPFNIDREIPSHNIYLTHAPLNNFLEISTYLYRTSIEKFRQFLYLFLMKGVHVNSLHATECPPLVYAQYIYSVDEELHTGFIELLRIFLEHGCDVDCCSAEQTYKGAVFVPEPFRTALEIYPKSAPVLMTLSVFNEADKYLVYAVKKNLLGLMPEEILNQLLSMVDWRLNGTPPESLERMVPSLKHLSRCSIRSHYRRMTKYWSSSVKKFRTKLFVEAVSGLPLPPTIQKFVRYMDYGYGFKDNYF